ncbi:MAG TPA: hypothetical protein VF395_20035 [Polyangiaceae bacterium]
MRVSIGQREALEVGQGRNLRAKCVGYLVADADKGPKETLRFKPFGALSLAPVAVAGAHPANSVNRA